MQQTCSNVRTTRAQTLTAPYPQGPKLKTSGRLLGDVLAMSCTTARNSIVFVSLVCYLVLSALHFARHLAQERWQLVHRSDPSGNATSPYTRPSCSSDVCADTVRQSEESKANLELGGLVPKLLPVLRVALNNTHVQTVFFVSSLLSDLRIGARSGTMHEGGQESPD